METDDRSNLTSFFSIYMYAYIRVSVFKTQHSVSTNHQKDQFTERLFG